MYMPQSVDRRLSRGPHRGRIPKKRILRISANRTVERGPHNGVLSFRAFRRATARIDRLRIRRNVWHDLDLSFEQ